MKNSDEAYAAAQKVDDVINKTLDEYPITADNWYEYTAFARTIRTSVNVIEAEIARKKHEALNRAHTE